MKESRIKKERRERFIKIICIYENDITRFLYHTLGDAQIALDIKQDAMEKAWKAFDSLKDEKCAKGWVFKIAENEAKQYYRKNSQKDIYIYEPPNNENFSMDNYSDGKDKVIEELLQNYESDILEKCLMGLDAKYRKLLQMRYLQGMSTKEIAEIMDLNHNTVRVYIIRAVEKARALYLEIERGEQK